MNAYQRINGVLLSLWKWRRAIRLIALLSGSVLGIIAVRGQTPQYIVTEPWVGYRLEPAGEAGQDPS